jgi:hypothetical protein
VSVLLGGKINWLNCSVDYSRDKKLLVTPFVTEEDFKKTVFATQDIFLKIYFSFEIQVRERIKPIIADIV